jgi:hypothetical protein
MAARYRFRKPNPKTPLGAEKRRKTKKDWLFIRHGFSLE